MQREAVLICEKGQASAMVWKSCARKEFLQFRFLFVNLLRKEGRSSGLEVHPQVIKAMRVSLLGISAGRLSRLVSGRIPRSTLNMICMGLVTSEHTDTHRHTSS